MTEFDGVRISQDIKKDIVISLIEPTYKNEIRNNLNLKKNFKYFGRLFETLSKFFLGVSSIMSFASGIYKFQILSFMAGTSSVVSLVLLQYSSFSYRESKKITIEINSMLKKLNIDTIPNDKSNDDSSNLDVCENFQMVSPDTPPNDKLNVPLPRTSVRISNIRSKSESEIN